jgi:hypothetical protein
MSGIEAELDAVGIERKGGLVRPVSDSGKRE